jgi:hypothetical protein
VNEVVRWKKCGGEVIAKRGDEVICLMGWGFIC